MDYLELYDMERYLFDVVKTAFHQNGKLSAFDFFCIVIWKANRAKSKVALKLLSRDDNGRMDLNAIAEDLTSAIAKARDDKERMRILIERWDFRLPTASAILTVLYPETFTVYDIRVCNELANHHSVQNRSRFYALWTGYQLYLDDVKRREPAIPALRDKDRTLWAKASQRQLIHDISTSFRKDDE